MEKLEMIEKLLERSDLSVEEARNILEKNNWDIIDAMVELERVGKNLGGAEASTGRHEPEYETVAPTVSGRQEENERRKRGQQAFREKGKKFVRILIDNKFVIMNKNGELMLRLPVIVPVVCAVANIWLTAIVLIAGAAFGFRYSFEGEEFGKQSVNDGVAKVTEYTKNIVNGITGKNAQDK